MRSALLSTTVLAVSIVAGAQANKVKIVKADQAAAVAGVLQKSELPTAFTWTAGKLDTTPTSSPTGCKGFHPKTSDLVTTGKASITYSAGGIQTQSQAELLQTAAMVKADFTRTFTSAFLQCLAAQFQSGAKGLKVLQGGKLNFPKDAPMTAAYRLIFSITANGKTNEGIVDLVALGSGRKELSFTLTAIIGTAKQVQQDSQAIASIDLALAGDLAKRVLGLQPKP